MNERPGAITKGGDPLTLLGEEIKVGDTAPDFTAVAIDGSEVSLSNVKGKAVMLVSVPSLDTPVCDTETRRFNEEAAKLGADVRILVISMDLPYAQKRWCGAAGIDAVTTLSDHRTAEFGEKYGLLIKGARLLARAVLVVDADRKVRYVQLAPDLKQEPDYDMAIEAARQIL